MSCQKERLLPCSLCRERHLKCNGNLPCLTCEKSGLDCVRPTKRFRFKKPRHDESLSFSSDQTWIRTRNHRLSYVDETEQILRANAADSSDSADTVEQDREAIPENQQTQARLDLNREHDESCSIVPHSPGTSNSANSFEQSTRSPSISRSALDSPQRRVVSEVYLEHASTEDSPSSRCESFQPGVYSECSPFATTSTPAIAPIDSNERESGNESYVGLQEACLIRHFAENLAHSFDTTDRNCHFTLTVPQRAMYNPVLLFAICTASARHLTRLWHKNHPNKMIEFHGIPLPDLDEHSAIHYHNLCISYLIDFSKNPSQGPSEEALAAATILRFYEQIDAPLTGLDSETYLNVVQTVINSQQTETLYSIPSVQEPLREIVIDNPQAHGLRFSAHLIALRQEIWSVLLYRRPFRLPSCPNNDYQNLQPADEFVWVNRILIWCGDVVKFCFGTEYSHENTSASKSKLEQWQAMKAFEESWAILQPPGFKPLYHSPANPALGEYFPTIWQMNDCQTLGIQHIEIGRMLLWVYNPQRQLLGIGSSATNQELETKIRHSVLTLCGLALANKKFQAGMTTAAVGVSLFGESFHDPAEQTAIIKFMTALETEHAWPTERVVDALQVAWNSRR